MRVPSPAASTTAESGRFVTAIVYRVSGVMKPHVTYLTASFSAEASTGAVGIKRTITTALALLVVAGSCGGSGSTAGAQTREVLVDYRHDDFESAFFSYFPSAVTVRAGDTVRFKQEWTGEPHSVTMGTMVDQLIDHANLIFEYESWDDALAKGVPAEEVDAGRNALVRLPEMIDYDGNAMQAGAQPCYIDDYEDIPVFYVETHAQPTPAAAEPCPTAQRKQPAFNGRQALYNSGFIPFEGVGQNTFEVPIASDTPPGTYAYYCNYHFLEMSGTIKVVEPSKEIPSASAVAKAGRAQLKRQAAPARSEYRQAVDRVRNNGSLLSGVDTGNYVTQVNEFVPDTYRVKVGEKAVWHNGGDTPHTVSFNVPDYFPVFTVGKDRRVKVDPRANDPVGFDIAPGERRHGPIPPDPRDIDAGEWDGSGGFHSSGSLNTGDTFSIRFTKPGTYDYACVVHPPMVGKVIVG